MIDLDGHRNIHCIGLGGIGLSAIAEILLSRGYNVSGSDRHVNFLSDNISMRGRVNNDINVKMATTINVNSTGNFLKKLYL